MAHAKPNPKIKTAAFGVEPGYAPFRLRQARYQALAEAVADYCRAAPRSKRVQLLDVGVGCGRSMRYIEAQRGTESIDFHGVDLFPEGDDGVYQRDRWKLQQGDFEEGIPYVESNRYDVVICEQVLEHLENVEGMLHDLQRVLRPGGLLILGVPVFPHVLHLIPKHCGPLLEKLTTPVEKRRKARHGHVQAFSVRTFLNVIRRSTNLEIRESRGFRILSGGPLRVLEHYEWWYKLNRAVGARLPGLCTEVQVLITKPAAAVLAQPKLRIAA